MFLLFWVNMKLPAKRRALCARMELLILKKLQIRQLVVDVFVQLLKRASVVEVMIGDCDRAAFFKIFNFRIVTACRLVNRKRSFGAICKSVMPQMFWRDDRDDAKHAVKLMFECLVFTPAIYSIHDDVLLA